MNRTKAKREYILLYISSFAYVFANSLIEIFGTVMLYKNGMSIANILLLYGLRFGLNGICSPIFLTISSRFGIAACSLIGNVLRIIICYLLLFNASVNLIWLVILMGLAGAVTHPMANALSSKYIMTQNRGRYNSMRGVVEILAAAASGIIIALGVTKESNLTTLILIIVFFLADYICVKLIDYLPERKQANAFKYVLKGKNSLKTICSMKAFHVIERGFVYLYLFIVLEDFVLFSTVLIVSIILEIIPVIVTGRLTDRNSIKTNNVVTVLKMLISGIFIVTKNKAIVSVNNTAYRNLEKVYETNYNSIVQNEIAQSDEDPDFISAICEMYLCFTELVVLLLLALATIYIHEKVFVVIFLGSIIGSAVINSKNKKLLKR